MHILITAGPTREPIDAVRFIGNRSSGTMGIAIANAAIAAGHPVTLLMGPGPSADVLPAGATVARFETTAELEALLNEHFSRCDVLIMAAAVADYRPIDPVAEKLPRSAGGGITIELEATPDLVGNLAGVKRDEQRVIAFALEEPAVLETRAVEKMQRKKVDAIVANPLGTMEAGEIEAIVFTSGGGRLSPGSMSKASFAKWLIDDLESDVLGMKPTDAVDS